MEALKLIQFIIKIFASILLIFNGKDAVFAQQLTLSECVKSAIENHPDIKAGFLQSGIAKAGVDQAKSNFLPDVGASVSQSGRFGRSIDIFTNDYIDDINYSTGAGVGLNMPLFTSFRNTYLLASAKSSLSAAEIAVETVKNTQTQAVLAAYINGLALQENILNAARQLKNDSIQYQRLTMRKQAGLITKTEEIQLLNQVRGDELVLLDAKMNYEVAIAELSRLMNRDLSSNTRLQNIEPDNTLMFSETVVVYDQLPQFKEASWRLKSLDQNIKATKALSYPRVNMSADYGTFYASSNPDRSFGQQLNDTRNGAVSIGLYIPILGGMKNRPQVQQMKLQEMLAQNDLDRTKMQLNQELKLAKTRLQNLNKRYETASSLYKLAEENMQLIQDQVDAGTATMVDFLLAQINMDRALTSRTNAKYQLIHQEKLYKFYTTGQFDLK